MHHLSIGVFKSDRKHHGFGHQATESTERPRVPSSFRHESHTLNSDDHKDRIPGRLRAQIAVSAVRFGGGSGFCFKKPFRIFDLPATRSESRQNQVRHTVGRNRRSVGPPENGLRFVSFLPHKQSVTDPHNPLVPDSSPVGPTILHINHGLMALGPRDSDPLVDGLFGALIGSFCDE
jgi:hypothetical protein